MTEPSRAEGSGRGADELRANTVFEWNLGLGSQSRSPDCDQVPWHISRTMTQEQSDLGCSVTRLGLWSDRGSSFISRTDMGYLTQGCLPFLGQGEVPLASLGRGTARAILWCL